MPTSFNHISDCRIGWYSYHTENLHDKRNPGKADPCVTMERSVPLNLDLTCMAVDSSLEESLAIAASALALVKSCDPQIITIQCLINEESLDYLLFKKLPANNYSKLFTKSADASRQPNTCVAWQVTWLNIPLRLFLPPDDLLQRHRGGPLPRGQDLPPH